MKKIMALAGATLALVGALALAGCAPRADRANRTDNGTTQQQGPAAPAQNQQPAPAANTGGSGTSSVDSDLSNVDSTLGGIDSDLSAAAQAPGDAD
jgi:hypothetical protein